MNKTDFDAIHKWRDKINSRKNTLHQIRKNTSDETVRDVADDLLDCCELLDKIIENHTK